MEKKMTKKAWDSFYDEADRIVYARFRDFAKKALDFDAPEKLG